MALGILSRRPRCRRHCAPLSRLPSCQTTQVFISRTHAIALAYARPVGAAVCQTFFTRCLSLQCTYGRHTGQPNVCTLYAVNAAICRRHVRRSAAIRKRAARARRRRRARAAAARLVCEQGQHRQVAARAARSGARARISLPQRSQGAAGLRGILSCPAAEGELEMEWI